MSRIINKQLTAEQIKEVVKTVNRTKTIHDLAAEFGVVVSVIQQTINWFRKNGVEIPSRKMSASYGKALAELKLQTPSLFKK